MRLFGYIDNLFDREYFQGAFRLWDERIAAAQRLSFSRRGHETTTLIETRHLHFAYSVSPVVVDVSLELPRGTMATVIGATGSGKSTLITHDLMMLDSVPNLIFAMRADGWLRAVRLNRVLTDTMLGEIYEAPVHTLRNAGRTFVWAEL